MLGSAWKQVGPWIRVCGKFTLVPTKIISDEIKLFLQFLIRTKLRENYKIDEDYRHWDSTCVFILPLLSFTLGEKDTHTPWDTIHEGLENAASPGQLSYMLDIVTCWCVDHAVIYSCISYCCYFCFQWWYLPHNAQGAVVKVTFKTSAQASA